MKLPHVPESLGWVAKVGVCPRKWVSFRMRTALCCLVLTRSGRKRWLAPSWEIYCQGNVEIHIPAMQRRAGIFCLHKAVTQTFVKWPKKKVIVISKKKCLLQRGWAPPSHSPTHPQGTVNQILLHGKATANALNIMKCQVWASIQILFCFRYLPLKKYTWKFLEVLGL